MTKELKQKTGEKKTTATVEELITRAEQEPKATRNKTGEKRTERLNLIIEPSTWADFKLLANMKQTTPNNLFCEVIKATVEQEQEKLTKYKEFIGG